MALGKNIEWYQILRRMMIIQVEPQVSTGFLLPVENKLQIPFQTLQRRQRFGACLIHSLCSHRTPSHLTGQSSPIPCLLAATQTPSMFLPQSLCIWNVLFLCIRMAQSLHCPQSFLRVNFLIVMVATKAGNIKKNSKKKHYKSCPLNIKCLILEV